MICIQKIYGFQGLNHRIIEESWDVTPVTDERKVENRAVFWIESETAINDKFTLLSFQVATITQWHPEKLLPPVRFQALVGCLRLTTNCINSLEQKRLIMFWLVGSKIITEQWIGGYLILDGSIYISNSAIDGLSGQTIGQKRQYIWNNLRIYLGVLVKIFRLKII